MILADIMNLWTSAWPAGVIMLALAGVFALALLIADEKLKVTVDPKIEQIHKALPCIDCGTCGYAGCASYAKAIAENPSLIGKCAPGGAQASEKIAKILNIQIAGGSGNAPQRPIVHCRAHTDDRTYYAKYDCIPTCTAENSMPTVQACKFGCLGYGDCVAACKFSALKIVDGLATVNYEKCTGCTACSHACPRNLIEMVPFSQENMMTVACRSRENGKTTRLMCKVGCIACGICTKQSDLFKVENFLAKVDYKNYQPGPQTDSAMQKCPTKVIVLRGKTADQATEQITHKKEEATI